MGDTEGKSGLNLDIRVLPGFLDVHLFAHGLVFREEPAIIALIVIVSPQLSYSPGTASSGSDKSPSLRN